MAAEEFDVHRSLELLLHGGGQFCGDVGTLGGSRVRETPHAVPRGKCVGWEAESDETPHALLRWQTGGGQSGVNTGVPVTPGFFFVGGIVEFDDQDRAEFVAGAEEKIDVLGLDTVKVGLPVGCSLRHVNEVGESDFGEHEQLAI